jgi:hypothetical protein
VLVLLLAAAATALAIAVIGAVRAKPTTEQVKGVGDIAAAMEEVAKRLKEKDVPAKDQNTVLVAATKYVQAITALDRAVRRPGIVTDALRASVALALLAVTVVAIEVLS